MGSGDENGSANGNGEKRDTRGRFVNSPGPGRPRKPQPPEEPDPTIDDATPDEILRRLLKSADESIRLQAVKESLRRKDAGIGREVGGGGLAGDPDCQFLTFAEHGLDQPAEEMGRILDRVRRYGAKLALDLRGVPPEVMRTFIRETATVQS